MHFLKPWEWNKPIVAFCTSDNLFLLKNLSVFFLAWNNIIYVLGANLQLPPSWFFYLVKINRKNVSQFTKQFLAIVFILIFGIDSVFQNHAMEINGEMYKNIDTPIKFLRKNNEFLFLQNINFLLQISIMTLNDILINSKHFWVLRDNLESK